MTDIKDSRLEWFSVLAFLAFLSLLMLVSVGVNGVTASAPINNSADKPSIVLILTDDQRWDTLWAMPVVQSELVAKGINFTNGFVVNSLCCPSRASILTGQYSHSTGVYRNAPPHGGFESFADKSTIATWLQKAGYKTSFIGKYLNGYYFNDQRQYIPPGWDNWVSFASREAGYIGYNLVINGETHYFGRGEEDYSTDVLANEAVSFITQTKGPIFVVYAPYAPHAPWLPAERHRGTFEDLPPHNPPSFDEEDVSDKPTWVRTLDPVGSNEAMRKNQYQTLLAVDDGVGSIIEALEKTGRLSNTMIVFTSDNGYHWGEHRWLTKQTPYEEAIRVPFAVRYDELVKNPGTESKKMVLNIDLAPTFADLAGVTMPKVDGKSFVALLSGNDGVWRTDFLIEHAKDKSRTGERRNIAAKIPPYCALRGENFSYVNYKTGEQELYDLFADPYQLDNLAANPAYEGIRDQMNKRTMELCRPLPPGFFP